MKIFRYVFYFMLLSFLFTVFAYTRAGADDKLILLLEIIITGAATLTYWLLTKKNSLRSITPLRYLEWSITTPLMLLVLCLVMNIFSVPLILILIALDLLMLWFGYAGETNQIHRLTAMWGFVPLLLIFYLLYANASAVNFLFILYLVGWTGYGIVYYFDERTKNTWMSVLDAVSKGLVAILISKNAMFPARDDLVKLKKIS